MAVTIESLHKAVVETWKILKPDRWLTISNKLAHDADRVLQWLETSSRFTKHHTKIPYITPTMRDAIDDNQPDRLCVKLEKQSWLVLTYLSGGGQGTVSVACPIDPDATADDLVALKKPKTTLDAKSLKSAQQYLLNECCILSQLKSTPYIAAFVDQSLMLPALATRLVHGRSLEQRVYDERRLSVFDVVCVGIDVCSALGLLHEIGHIHKDVKPANIILEADKNAVLIDFGLAEIPDAADLRSNGTPYYIAPEVYLRQEVPDARADVFSLAAVLFQALAGQPPHFQQCLNPNHYRASGAELDLKRFLHEQSAIDCDINDIRTDVPVVLGLLLSLSLSTSRDARPATAQKFCETLVTIRQSLLEASEIEKRLWNFFKILLEAYRAIHKDDIYKNEWKNARQISKTLVKTEADFVDLTRLLQQTDTWLGFPSVFALTSRSLKLLEHFRTNSQQLARFLRDYPPATDGNHSDTPLLKELLVRSLESVRRTSTDVYSCAHDWRSALHQLGVPAPARQ